MLHLRGVWSITLFGVLSLTHVDIVWRVHTLSQGLVILTQIASSLIAHSTGLPLPSLKGCGFVEAHAVIRPLRAPHSWGGTGRSLLHWSSCPFKVGPPSGLFLTLSHLLSHLLSFLLSHPAKACMLGPILKSVLMFECSLKDGVMLLSYHWCWGWWCLWVFIEHCRLWEVVKFEPQSLTGSLQRNLSASWRLSLIEGNFVWMR
jgi:hypothetical protein